MNPPRSQQWNASMNEPLQAVWNVPSVCLVKDFIFAMSSATLGHAGIVEELGTFEFTWATFYTDRNDTR